MISGNQKYNANLGIVKGLRIGRLMVVRRIGSLQGHSSYECQCDCGNKIEVKARYLKTATRVERSCGCVKRISAKFKDLTGRKFGRLTVLNREKNHVGATKECSRWKCKCDCGNEVVVLGETLARKNRSCGCLHLENHRLEKGLAAKRYCFRMTKAVAERRGFFFSLDFDEYVKICEKPCSYCGAAPSQMQSGCHRHDKFKAHYGNWIHGGIDRIDNAKNYVSENCTSCCKFCNIAKMTLTREAFLAHVSHTYDHLNGILSIKECAIRRDKNVRGLFGNSDGKKSLFNNTKGQAKRRGLPFAITFNDYVNLCELPCSYCGSPPSTKQQLGKDGGVWLHGGIDRADPDKGYIPSNCAPCCEVCNIMKATMTRAEFYAHIESIVTYSSGIIESRTGDKQS